MVDQVTSNSGTPSPADLLLEQFAATERNFRKELETLQADLTRLSGELKALARELEALQAAPGDHQKEIAEVEKKIAEKSMATDTLTDRIKAGNLTYQAQFDVLSQVLAEMNKIIMNTAQKTGR